VPWIGGLFFYYSTEVFVAKRMNADELFFDLGRLVCLRVHPTFTLLNPTEVVVSFKSIDGSNHEISPESEEQFFEGNHRPNGN
jgi:hypothetical protein